jgi:hypothetical protein
MRRLISGELTNYRVVRTSPEPLQERIERGRVGTISKDDLAYLYSAAREQAFSSRNIRAGWEEAGLFPV